VKHIINIGGDKEMIEFEFNVEDCAEDETYYEICSLIQLVYRFEYNQKIAISAVYYNEPLERIFKIPLEKMPPLQKRKHKNVD
jgi:hypothetical protein